MIITPDDIVTYARTWIGAKWRHQGRGHGPDRGIDCAGLLVRTAQNFNLPCEDLQGYRRDPSIQFVRQINTFTIKHNIPIHGAIGIFNDTVQPCHTGIFAVDPITGRVTVIHAESMPKRRVHEQDYSESIPSLKDRLVSIRLFKGVDYGL
ncbi:NlpC/P60 family cell wall peptidase [Ruegeria phage vB_RpoS-V10]|nr:NlpC/P60 family cell wall peptidase [Roseobacter phage DSS3P8]AWY09172.1 NlpC/P60 family cell wall peptidase [Ruegeria phage vB_RpoS-V10]